MNGDPYNFKVYNPQNFIYEIPAQFLLPDSTKIKVTIKSFYNQIVEATAPDYKNIKIYTGQNHYKQLSLTQLSSTEKSFKLNWVNSSPSNNENIGFSDGLGVIDEVEYQKYFFQQVNYSNYLDMVNNDSSFNGFPADYNGFEIYDKLKKAKEITNKIIEYYDKIMDELTSKSNDLNPDDVSTIKDNLIGILNNTTASSGKDWSTTDNSLIVFYNEMHDYYLQYLKQTKISNENNKPPLEMVKIDDKDYYLDQAIIEVSNRANEYLKTYEFASTIDQFIHYDQIYPLVDSIQIFIEDFAYLIGYPKSDDTEVFCMSSLHEQLLKYWDENYNPDDYNLELINLSVYDNKYCAYWFMRDDYSYDSMAGQGWKYIDGSWNKGIPTQLAAEEKNLPVYANDSQDKYTLPEGIQASSLKVILFANHVPYFAEIRIQ